MQNRMNQQSRCRTSNYRPNCDYCRQRGGGFTLAEILVALGILAIGMAMVAAIFPAAMEFNRASTNDTLGTIICENGLVLAELAMTAEAVDAAIASAGVEEGQLTILADDLREEFLKKSQMRYPTDSGNVKTGFVMMIRKIPVGGGAVGGAAGESGAYQLVTVAYRKTKKENTVVVVPIGCTVSGKDITGGGAGKLRIGSPLINAETGEFMIIDSINMAGTKGTLHIPDGFTATFSGNSFYAIVECDSGGNILPVKDMRRSPAIKGMSVVTGLVKKPGT
jgi:prepilin-type N-terminal cleavage/methylation domain-containing protein